MNQVALGCFVESRSQIRARFDCLFFVASFNCCESFLTKGFHAALVSAVALGAGRSLTDALDCGFGIGHDVLKFLEVDFRCEGAGS